MTSRLPRPTPKRLKRMSLPFRMSNIKYPPTPTDDGSSLLSARSTDFESPLFLPVSHGSPLDWAMGDAANSSMVPDPAPIYLSQRSHTLHGSSTPMPMGSYHRASTPSSPIDHDLLTPIIRAQHVLHQHYLANLNAISQAMLSADVPSYISARSANSIISESRPTRIQAETLSFLNRILDELLLFIVASARSLATDRLKTDGLLKVMNNNVLAKDAVLEAELELRNYLLSKKAEGGRVPLGLSATSRWDGTEAFPVASAYAAVSRHTLGR